MTRRHVSAEEALLLFEMGVPVQAGYQLVCAGADWATLANREFRVISKLDISEEPYNGYDGSLYTRRYYV